MVRWLALLPIAVASDPVCESSLWPLVWHDEFNGDTLNSSKWEIEVNCWGGGNNEMQCYTARQDNVRLDGSGHLVIEAKKEDYTGSVAGCTQAQGCTWSKQFTSGRVRTLTDKTLKCVAKRTASVKALCDSIGWACTQISCTSAEKVCTGDVRFTNADTVFDRYYQAKKGGGATCDFGGAATPQKNSLNSWKYGRMEVRAKLPAGHGMWPALWMLPTDQVYGTWPASGEIDILEARGGQVDTILGTLHYGGIYPTHKHTGSGDTKLSCMADFSADFHDYALVWTPTSMSWLVDGVRFHTQNLDQSFGSHYSANFQPFEQRFHMILNLAIGGNFWGTPPAAADIDMKNPKLVVDHVRIYQPPSYLSGNNGVNEGAAASTPKCVAKRTATGLCDSIGWACTQISCTSAEKVCTGDVRFTNADTVFDRYYQAKKGGGATCDFGGKATLSGGGECPAAGARCLLKNPLSASPAPPSNAPTPAPTSMPCREWNYKVSVNEQCGPLRTACVNVLTLAESEDPRKQALCSSSECTQYLQCIKTMLDASGCDDDGHEAYHNYWRGTCDDSLPAQYTVHWPSTLMYLLEAR